MSARRWWWVVAWLAGGCAFAIAQEEEVDPSQPAEPPELATQVLRALEASYLTEAEGKDLRIFHGVWREGDLDTPARQARAALMSGAYQDPSLSNPDAAAEDRADAMIVLGHARDAITLLDDMVTARAIRLRAHAYETLGEYDHADQAIDPLLAGLGRVRTESAEALVEGVRGLLLRARVKGQQIGAGEDFRSMMSILGRARDELDRTDWTVRLVEAELLHQKDNRKDAAEAAIEALSLNPRTADAWVLLGEMSVEGFDFARAEQVALRLDLLASESEGEGSLLGDLLRVRIRLRQRDADEAARLIAGVLERAPEMPEALELQAAVAAAQFDFDRTAALVQDADERAPDSDRTLLEVGRTLSDMRQYEQAIDYLKQAAARAPFRAEAWIELGLVALQAGDDDLALDALTKANELEPFNDRAANSYTLIKALLEYSRLDSEHFIIRYRPGEDEVLARDMLVVLEKIHDRVTGSANNGIDHEPGVKTQIELMPDHRWFAVRIAGMPALHTMAAATGPVLALEAPRVGAGHTIGHYDWPRVVQHEYTHTVTLSRTNNRIPHWLTEASAVYMEDSPRDYGRARLLASRLAADDLFDLEDVNVAFIRPRRPNDRSMAYAQSNWMYEYILERWGNPRMLDLMDAFAKGESQTKAWQEVLGVTPSEFLDAFEKWARQQVVSWGLLPPDGEPTLEEIRLEDALSDDARRRGLATWLAESAAAGAWNAAGAHADAPASPKLAAPSAEKVNEWLSVHPDHPDLLELAVHMALDESGGTATDDMVPLLERYATARPVDPLPHRLLAEHFLAKEGQERTRAIEHLEWLDAREQGSVAYAAALARLYASIGDWTHAHDKAERVTQMAPYVAANREVAASVAIQAREMDDAERHLVALTMLEPDREVHQRRLEAFRKLRQQEGSSSNDRSAH